MGTLEENLAKSLTAESTDILPYLPYLLQDLWQLGSSPTDMLRLFQTHIPHSASTRVLDLGCGKGAVSVRLAEALGVSVKGIDIVPEFIDYARDKAREYGVAPLCDFRTGDIGRAVEEEQGFDCVIYGAVGPVLGEHKSMLEKLTKPLRPGGFLLIDDAYLLADVEEGQVRFDYTCPTWEEWLALFFELDLKLVDHITGAGDCDFDADTAQIARRAAELSERHPDKTGLFDAYVKSQMDECYDLEHSLVGVTWLLRRQ